jgi:CRISPR/Cas system-associated protein Cas10 (large subunit of type III CRISPR-Cas system)
MTEVPVERRTYFPVTGPLDTERRACPVCGRPAFVPWYLRRDRERRVWRRWVCTVCQAHQDVPEDQSA